MNKPSEKITCPFCATERDYGITADMDHEIHQVVCYTCCRYFALAHALLAVQHAKLAAAVREHKRLVDECASSADSEALLASWGKMLSARETMHKALEDLR